MGINKKELELNKRFRRVLRESDYLETYLGKKKHVGLICARLVQAIRDIERSDLESDGSKEVVYEGKESDPFFQEDEVENERYI